jgi:hypothetical protein
MSRALTCLSAFSLAAATAVSLSPATAWACPACAGRDDGTGGRTLWLMGTMLLIPFCIVAVVVRVMRRLERDEPSLPRLGSDS